MPGTCQDLNIRSKFLSGYGGLLVSYRNYSQCYHFVLQSLDSFLVGLFLGI